MVTAIPSVTEVHVGYESQEPSLPSSFRFPAAWAEYQDDRYGQEVRQDRERYLTRSLGESGITRVVTLLGEDHDRYLSAVFTLDVSKSLARLQKTSLALRDLTDSIEGTLPGTEGLGMALTALADRGVRSVYCMPSPNMLGDMARDLAMARETLSLPGDADVIFAWSGSIIQAKASDTWNELYREVEKI